MPIVFERPTVNINLYPENKMFEVNIISDEKYNDPGFLEFIDYFKSTWNYVKEQNENYFMIINIKAKGEQDLPLSAFIKLVQAITELHQIFVKHLHSCCIISSGAQRWQDTYDFVTKLYKPPDQRPLKFTDNLEDAQRFLITNQIITEKN